MRMAATKGRRSSDMTLLGKSWVVTFLLLLGWFSCLDTIICESSTAGAPTCREEDRTEGCGGIEATPVLPTQQEKEEEGNKVVEEPVEEHPCTLFMAPNPENPTGYGIYTSVDLPAGATVGSPEEFRELFVTLQDVYKTAPYRGQQRWLSWLDYVRGPTKLQTPINRARHVLTVEEMRRSFTGPQFTSGKVGMGRRLGKGTNYHSHDAFGPGLTALATHPTYGPGNLKMESSATLSFSSSSQKDGHGHGTSTSTTMTTGPGVGAVTDHRFVKFVTAAPVKAGSELTMLPSDEEIAAANERAEQRDELSRERRGVSSQKLQHMVELEFAPDWLQRQGQCLDHFAVRPSSIEHAGDGVFAKSSFTEGTVLWTTPLAVLKRSDLTLHPTDGEAKHYQNVLNTDEVVGTELLINYCYGHPDSELLFLPLAPLVNFLNHGGVASDRPANAKVRWPATAWDGTAVKPISVHPWLERHPLDLLDQSAKITMEIVATRPIAVGEEILLDYGSAWQHAWEEHVRNFVPPPTRPSATDYEVRTLEEQVTNPYPEGIFTVCDFASFSKKTSCWLPCDIEKKIVRNNGVNTLFVGNYDVERHGALARATAVAWDSCGNKKDRFRSESLRPSGVSTARIDDSRMDPRNSEYVRWIHAQAFRHFVGLPDDMVPLEWRGEGKTVYELTPTPLDLKAGQYVPITYKHSGRPVTRNGYFIGLPKDYNDNMKAFAEEVGVMDTFRDILSGRYNQPGTIRHVDYPNAGTWYVQRPNWNSNMHWIIPYSETARMRYLGAMSKNGFDQVLDAVGTGFGLHNLTCFHNTFLGITQADDSNIHCDFYETQRKSFDILYPIVMANSTKPEFHIQSSDGNVIVGIKYRKNVGVVVGDWTYHKSAPVSYTPEEGMRIVASNYCSEITQENRESLLEMYHEEYPAPFYELFDVPLQEWHWDRKGQTLPS